MAELVLKKLWESLNAKFCQLNSDCVVEEVDGFEKESKALRKSVVLSDFSFVKKFEYPEGEGIDYLDTVLAQNILKLRYGRIIDTFLASEKGEVVAECFVGNIDDKLFLMAESIASDEFLKSKLLPDFAKDLSETFVLLNVDGPEAWKVANAIFGSEVLNLPYLSIEKYDFEGSEVYLMRNGKTGEFGYQFLAPIEIAELLFARLKNEVMVLGGAIAGVKSLFNGRLEGNFFNIYAEGELVKNPIILGLQWMIDFDKSEFVGSEQIFSDRAIAKELTLVGLKGNSPFLLGEKIYNNAEEIGEVVACGVSQTLGVNLALAKFKKFYAYPNFDYYKNENSAEEVSTIAMPPIVALSLQNGLDS